MSDVHQRIREDLSDLLDGRLERARAQEVEAHLAGCAECSTERDAIAGAIAATRALRHARAPRDLDERVAQTIHRRSAGRFFGKKAFGDRVPYELLAIAALLLALGVVLLLRWSATGSVHEPLEKNPARPAIAPGAREVMPRP